MIDCHCHLADTKFDEDIDRVISSAKQAGVKACIVNSENINEFDKILALNDKYPDFIFPSFGVHPVQYERQTNDNRSVRLEDINGLREKILENIDRIFSIGEVGLDFTPHYIKNEDDKTIQREVFKYQIELAKEFDLPLNMHSRSAGRPVVDFLIENGAKNVLLHAFSGNHKSALPAIKAGYYFSVPPCSINSDQKKSLFAQIPLNQLLLETDSPVLGPDKGERNEPANITYSARFIAELKNVDLETVIQTTKENALKLFPKLRKFVQL